MCKNFNGSHSGGSSFVNVNNCWLLQNLFVYHRYKYSFEKKKTKEKKKRSPSIWFRTLKPVRICQSGRIGIGGVTSFAAEKKGTADNPGFWLYFSERFSYSDQI